jgi:hypothetical protein
MQAARRAAIEAAAGARCWGLVLGTLGRQGNPRILAQLQGLLQAQGRQCVTVLLSGARRCEGKIGYIPLVVLVDRLCLLPACLPAVEEEGEEEAGRHRRTCCPSEPLSAPKLRRIAAVTAACHHLQRCRLPSWRPCRTA